VEEYNEVNKAKQGQSQGGAHGARSSLETLKKICHKWYTYVVLGQ